MITSVFGIVINGFGDQSTTVRYGNFKFKLEQFGYSTTVDDKKLFVDVLPQEVEYIAVPQQAISLLQTNPQVYMTHDPNSSSAPMMAAAEFSFAQTALTHLSTNIVPAFTVQNINGLPVVTCDDATEFFPVIMLRESDKTEVTVENNCIILDAATDPEILALKDRLVYALTGIMQ